MAMIQKEATAVAETAYGKKLDNPITYGFKWEDYGLTEDVVAAKDELTLEEQRKQRNVERKNNARQQALTLALAEAGIVKPTMETDPQLRLKRMYDVFVADAVANGRTAQEAHDEARTLASNALNIAWSD